MKKSKGSSSTAAATSRGKARFRIRSSSEVKSPVRSDGDAPQPRVAIVIMAAGKGTRLKSQLPKVLHEVGGRPLLEHVIRAAVRVAAAKDVYAIIGHEAERVRAATQ